MVLMYYDFNIIWFVLITTDNNVSLFVDSGYGLARKNICKSFIIFHFCISYMKHKKIYNSPQQYHLSKCIHDKILVYNVTHQTFAPHYQYLSHFGDNFKINNINTHYHHH